MYGARFQARQMKLNTFTEVLILSSSTFIIYNYYFIVTDLFIALELIPRRRLEKWINREGFCIRKILILKWIVLGSVLTWGYKSTFLSTLVTIRYNKPIHTLADLDSSGLPLLIVKNSTILRAVQSDPRPIMNQIYHKSIVFEYNQHTEPKYAAM